MVLGIGTEVIDGLVMCLCTERHPIWKPGEGASGLGRRTFHMEAWGGGHSIWRPGEGGHPIWRPGEGGIPYGGLGRGGIPYGGLGRGGIPYGGLGRGASHMEAWGGGASHMEAWGGGHPIWRPGVHSIGQELN